jgi:hypothetical protein
MAWFRKKQDNRVRIFRTVVILVIVFVVIAFAADKISSKKEGPDQREALAQCLTDKGARFYGAYWCPHCARQKKLFGRAISKVTYVECAIPGNTQAQTQQCKDANITGYPTWIFADGSRMSGEVALEDLAEKADCPWTP